MLGKFICRITGKHKATTNGLATWCLRCGAVKPPEAGDIFDPHGDGSIRPGDVMHDILMGLINSDGKPLVTTFRDDGTGPQLVDFHYYDPETGEPDDAGSSETRPDRSA